MQQAWHIFRKDVRYLYREIAFLIVLAAAGAWMPEGESADMGLIYAAAVAFTVARLIQAEAIPGQNQFWVTRPYRWRSLLAAKGLFLVAFVQLPVLIMQTVVLLQGGFSVGSIIRGLLWTQVLIVLAISLPSFALAAMTAGLIHFIATILVLLAIGFVGGEYLSRSLAFLAFGPESSDWVRYSIPFITTALAVPPVLYIQYKDRRTRISAILAASLALMGGVAFLSLPWRTLFAVQSHTSPQPVHVEISRDTGKPLAILPDGPNHRSLSAPLVIRGVPPDMRTQIELYDFQLQRADGRTLRVGSDFAGPSRITLRRQDQNPNELMLSGSLFPSPSFLEGPGDKHATLHVSFYLTLFGNRRDKTIPFRSTPVDALDGLRCFDGYENEVVCRAPFRWPGSIVSVKTPWGGSSTFTRLISYSPFPATLRLDPIVERSAGPHWSRDRQSAREVTIETERPLAFVRCDVEVPNLSLGDR